MTDYAAYNYHRKTGYDVKSPANILFELRYKQGADFIVKHRGTKNDCYAKMAELKKYSGYRKEKEFWKVQAI